MGSKLSEFKIRDNLLEINLTYEGFWYTFESFASQAFYDNFMYLVGFGNSKFYLLFKKTSINSVSLANCIS